MSVFKTWDLWRQAYTAAGYVDDEEQDMTTLREAAQQALEYLDAPSSKLWPAGTQHRIITALRAALEDGDNMSPTEPVAWYHVPHPGNGISPVVSMFQQHEPSLYAVAVPLFIREQL